MAHVHAAVAGVLAGVLGTAATGYILKNGSWDQVWSVAVSLKHAPHANSLYRSQSQFQYCRPLTSIVSLSKPIQARNCPLPKTLVLGSALWTHCLCYFSLPNHCHKSVCLCLQSPGGSLHCLSQQYWSCRWFCILWALWFGMFLRLESVSLTEWTITDCILRSILSTADVQCCMSKRGGVGGNSSHSLT